MNDAYPAVPPYPLDVLGAETEGELGYIIEMELDNAITGQHTVAVVTRTEVDADDPAFGEPDEVHRPGLRRGRMRSDWRGELGWTVKPDGDAWRRVVPSPEPRRIVQLAAIARLDRRRLPRRLRGRRRRPGRPRRRRHGRRRRGSHRQGPRVLAAGAASCGPTCSCSPRTSTASTTDFGEPEQRLLRAVTPARAAGRDASRPGRWARRSRPRAASSSVAAGARRSGRSMRSPSWSADAAGRRCAPLIECPSCTRRRTISQRCRQLLDRSFALAGPHLLRIATPERRLNAEQVADAADGDAPAGAGDRHRRRPADRRPGGRHLPARRVPLRIVARLCPLSPHRRPPARQRDAPAGRGARRHRARARRPRRHSRSDEGAELRRTLLDIYVPRYGPQWETEFLDSGPVYARIDAERMFTFHMDAGGG